MMYSNYKDRCVRMDDGGYGQASCTLSAVEFDFYKDKNCKQPDEDYTPISIIWNKCQPMMINGENRFAIMRSDQIPYVRD